MNTMNGSENGYVLPPQTAAGRMLYALDQPESLMVQVSDNQTAFDFSGGENVTPVGYGAPVELYDYVNDGVVFEEPDESVVEIPTETSTLAPAEVAGRPAKRLLQILAGRAVFELDMTDEGNDMITLSTHSHLTIQKPSVTYRQAKVVAKESGKVLLATVKEELRAPEASKPDKEAIAAVAFVCGQSIIKYSEQLGGNPTLVDLIGAIRQDHPELPNEPQFRSAINRLNKDPEGFKRAFVDLDRLAIVDKLPMVPAFHEFCAEHGINPNEALEG